jgi:hypothetical protein
MSYMLAEFDSLTDICVKPVEYQWDELVNKLSIFDKTEQKTGRLFSPTTYAPNSRRGNRHIISLSLAVFDVDGISQEEYEELRSRLANAQHIMYSTFSDSPESRCFRLVFPFPKEVHPSDLPKERNYFINMYGLKPDPATKDPARLYFFPISKTGTGEVHVVNNTTELEPWKKLLLKISNPETRDLARTIANGDPLAQSGGRDAAMQRAAGILAFTFPEAEVETLLEYATPSVSAMPSDNGLDFELNKLRKKLERAKERKQVKDQDDRDLADAFIEKKTQEAAVAKARRLIIQYRGETFFFLEPNGNYTGAQPRGNLDVGIHQYIKDKSLIVYEIDAKGKPRMLKMSDILRKNATIARNHVASLTEQKSYYDEQTETFVEAICPMRPFTPTQHPDVHAWLIAMGGDMSEKLLDWVACVTKLGQQCAAIILEGESGAGKGLFAAGLAKLWTVGPPTSFDAIVGDWNSRLTECPLVLADEGFTPSKRGSINDELRRVLGEQGFTLRRKYIPDTSINGAIRLILASNNPNMLNGFDEITQSDREALVARLIYVPIHTKDSKQILEALPRETKDEWANKKIAEHALWLRDTRTVVSGKRFIVEGTESAMHNRLLISSGMAPAMCEFLVHQVIEEATRKGRAACQDIKFGSGKLEVVPRIFKDEDKWKRWVPGFRIMLPKINAALTNLRAGPERFEGDRLFVELRVDLLETWAKLYSSSEWAAAKKAIGA